jgi:hypothetical protein
MPLIAIAGPKTPQSSGSPNLLPLFNVRQIIAALLQEFLIIAEELCLDAFCEEPEVFRCPLG